MNLNSFAQVNTYIFSQSSGAYFEITGDTIAYATGTSASTPQSLDDVIYTNDSLPFSFTFNAVANSNIRISSNGFVTFGALPGPTNYFPISSTTPYNGAVSGFGNDLIGTRGITGTRTSGSFVITGVVAAQFIGLETGKFITGTGIPAGTKITALNSGAGIITISNAAALSGTSTLLIATGSIIKGTSGSPGNRIHTIQFRNFRNFTTGANSNCINFQIKLFENSNIVEIIYGTNTSSSNEIGQVGLRGAGNSDFNNRTTSANWTATTPGTNNSETCTMITSILPESGRTFRWTPVGSLNNEVGVIAITNPLKGSNTLLSTPIAPKATIKNFGTANQTSFFNITCLINPGGYSSTKSDTLSSGLTHEIKFDSSFMPTVGTSYAMTVYTSLATDVYRSNDTLRQTSQYIFQNYGNDSGYFYANNLATNQPSYPKYSWKDTTGSVNLVLNGIQANGTAIVGSLDDGYFKLSLKNILLSLNIDTANKHFKYNGTCYDSIFPGTNGIIGFTENFGETSLSEFQIDGVLAPKYAILPFWKDFNFDTIGTGVGNTNRLSFKATGNELLITYDKVASFFPIEDWVSFQIIIGIVSGCGSTNSNFRYTYADTTTGQTSSSFVNNYLTGYNSLIDSSTAFRNYIIGYSNIGAAIPYAGFVSSGNPEPAIPQTQLSVKRPVYNLTSKRGLAVEFGFAQNSLNKFDGLVLRLNVALEGLQRNSQPRARDTISVILRDGSGAPYGIIQTVKVYLDSVNSGSKKFGQASVSLSLLESNVTFYIVVRHRNSISSWSNSIFSSGDTLVYDFTTSTSQTFGNNSVIVNTAASFYAGDVNQDLFIDISDILLIYNDATNFISGNYLAKDLNWDQIVDITDVLIAYNNSVNFISEKKPSGATSINPVKNFFDYHKATSTSVLADPYLMGRTKNQK